MSSTGHKDKRKEKGYGYLNGVRASDCMLYLYLVAFFGIYPWIMDNKYFNITITRFRFFIISSFIYIILAAVGYLIDAQTAKYYGVKLDLPNDNDVKRFARPDFWMGAFLISQLFAWVVAEDKNAAFTGENGRRLGLMFFIVVALLYFVISIRAKVYEVFLMIFAATSAFAYIVAIFQHMDIDFMGYKDNISPKSFDVFISTFGNINIFSSFLCMSIPAFMCLAIFSDNMAYRIVSLVVLLLGGMCIITANSDSAYLGIGAAALLIAALAYKRGCFGRFTYTLIGLALGNLVTVILNHTVIDDYDKRGGISEKLDKVGAAALMLTLSVVLCVLVLIIASFTKNKFQSVNKNKVIAASFGIIFICAAACFVYGVRSGSDSFTFNYKWGTYRGYIWTKCAELFRDAPAKNKIFGYGNESLKSLMKTYYNKEMISVTGKTYDNAHNEVLQYLITTGIAGAASYLGLVISSFVYILKKAKGRAFAYVCLAVMTGYFVQSLINVNQPITTPFYFVFMALGVGFVRVNSRQGKEA